TIVCHLLPPPLLACLLFRLLFPWQGFGSLTCFLGWIFGSWLLLLCIIPCSCLFGEYDLVPDLHHVLVVDVDCLHLGIGRNGYGNVLFNYREFRMYVIAIS